MRARRIAVGALVVAGIVLAALVCLRTLWLSSYPYGWSHCCLKGLGLALLTYAHENEGSFPAGAGSPEASLSLLYRGDYDIGAEVLRGKTVPVETTRNVLERGELLGPDSCGWHYVEGLTLSDDPHLALVWDKVGLDHNGRKLPGGGHSVWFVGGGEELVPGSEWPQFLERQQQLMAARTEPAKKGLPALSAKVRLPSGQIVDHYDAPFSLDIHYTHATGSGSGGPSGPKLHASTLRWHRMTPADCTMTLTLSLNGWKSGPVEVRVSQGKASPSSIVFEMETQSDTDGSP